MAKFDSKEELLVKIGEIYSKMGKETLEMSELDQLVQLSEELYQRNVILRYKAFEKKVFGEVSESVATDVVLPTIVKDETKASNSSFTETKVAEMEQTNFSFSLFDEPEQVEEPEAPSLDFSEPVAEVEVNEVSEAPSEPVTEVEVPEYLTNAFEKHVEHAPEQHLPVESNMLQESVEPLVETEIAPVLEAPLTDRPETDGHFEKTQPIAPVQEPEQEPVVSQVESVDQDVQVALYLQKFKKIESLMASQFGISKLVTLMGSFGLNEKLQFINELFKGSSDNFALAIKALDEQPSGQAAFLKVAEIGIQLNWDVESETVEAFMQKINRRYFA